MQRVRIADIAKELGVSTATVSNVIHGKTKKISDATVKRVQKLLEERQYIPSMAGLLLAQNDSRIIGIVMNNHGKYEGHVLEDPFVAASLNALSGEIEKAGYFMMVKTTSRLTDIVKFASMWNMEGMVIIGFCEEEYNELRQFMHIPFVVYDGFPADSPDDGRLCNLTIDNYDGGLQVGRHLRSLGHRRALCLSDNDICMDARRIRGFRDGFGAENTDLLIIPMQREPRRAFYEQHLPFIREHTAAFAVSDYYAVDFLQFVQEKGMHVPEEISIAGFDDTPICQQIVPTLTTVRQDPARRAASALLALRELKQGTPVRQPCMLPVQLMPRHSTAPFKISK
ncbi:LacI family DNA-binding transcriptional regulator [Anaerovibrio sp.]|uniref:LacI family DNA-binding transcriptional regulator n=1 Tax=Anaerovibrio sp. TaxID=1872532 RepID=UPI003F190B3F